MEGSFFGTDGIRDRAGEGRLAPPQVVRIGRAIGRFARSSSPDPVVFVARDPRPSGPAIVTGLAAGLAAEGARVEDGGILPTPAIAWWAGRDACDVAVAVTASHNPAEDNGIKLIVRGGRKASPEEERAVEVEIDAASPRARPASPTPRPDALEAYVAAAVSQLSPGGRLDGMRLVVDAANGATTVTAPRVLEALGAEVLGRVGRDLPRPINGGCGTQHPEAWQREVASTHGVTGGIAFDGDGDRVLLADEHGQILDGDPLLLLLGRDMAERGTLPGKTVVSTVMANLGLEEALSRAGLSLDRVAVGDRHVAARMRETGAGLGGEPSGHVLLEWDGVLVGDGLVAGVRALQAARRRGVPLSAVRLEIPRWPQVLVNVRVARRIPLEDSRTFSEAWRAAESRLAGRGRVVVRYSGTEPLLRIMVEARDRGEVDREIDALRTAAATIGV